MTKKIIFYPDYSGGNPYQTLLYEPCLASNWKVNSGTINEAITLLKKEDLIIFHMHWINFLFKECNNSLNAWKKVNGFIMSITHFKYNGGRLIWTIHNHLPHENPFPEQDSRIRHFLCKHADRIHLHCASHLRELDYLPIDYSKVTIHRIGSYINYYGKFDLNKRLESFRNNKLKCLFLGMLREYKGIDDLLAITNQLQLMGIQVTIAGNPENIDLKQKIEKFSLAKGINTILRRLTEKEVHELCLSHNVGIISYDKILTSATLKLYCGYGMLVLTPPLPTICAEDRYNSFCYYPKNAKKQEIKKIVDSFIAQSSSEYCYQATNNYFLAQESRWSTSLFDNI